MKPMIFRSASTRSAEALISMKNVSPMIASWTPNRRSTSVGSRQHRRGRGVAERTQRLADDVGGDPEEQVDVLHLPVAALDALQQLVEPVGAFAARRALAARFVAVEVQQV